ncbi:MAG TPA: hypothetical protein VNE63_04030 [Candidatus Acidoferrales bacterium]|nr:hypothetical protein [Candidatus Acidoferrales bacterium]
MSDPNGAGDFKRLATRMLVLFGAAVLLFPIGRAAAQDAPAGPLPAAQTADQLTVQPPSVPPAKSAAQIAGKPNLAGTWKLNTDDSDDHMKVMRESRQDSQGNGNGWGGRYGGGQYGGGGMGRGRSGAEGPGGMRNEFSQLTIEETPSMTKVTGSSGRVLALYSAPEDQGTANASSGQPQDTKPSSDENDANAVPTAQWQGSQLVATARSAAFS